MRCMRVCGRMRAERPAAALLCGSAVRGAVWIGAYTTVSDFVSYFVLLVSDICSQASTARLQLGSAIRS